MESFDSKAETSWIENNFALLNQNAFVEDTTNLSASNHKFHWDTFLVGKDEINMSAVIELKRQRLEAEETSAAIEQVQKERMREFAELCTMAKRPTDDQTDKAKKVLQDILKSDGGILNRTDNFIINKTVFRNQDKKGTWQSRAAAALADAATPGNGDLLARYVAEDLPDPTIGAAARISLAQAWIKLTAPVKACSCAYLSY